MRILVISDLPQFVTGGAEVQAGRLIKAWLDQGHEVVCLGRRMGRGPVRMDQHLVEVRRIWHLQHLGRLARALTYAWSLAWLLLRYRSWADVVYTRFLGEAAATAALLKRVRLIKSPLVATPANTYGKGDVYFLRSIPGSRLVIRLLDRQVDAINLIAEEMVGDLKAAGFAGRNFTHIPNGITVRPVTPKATAAFPRCLLVGRLSRQKGYDIWLKALARIKPKLHPGQFVVVGDGPEAPSLRALANELGVQDYVLWKGELNQKEVFEELEQATLYILPSRYEGMSNAALEAMERSLPLVLTRCGGIDRYIEADMGWLAEPDDEVTLAKALSQALAATPDTLSAMGARCREAIESHFDIRNTSKAYIELFEQLRRMAGGA
jgi:glycosyltransferase involved in cell wall biosynthesis